MAERQFPSNSDVSLNAPPPPGPPIQQAPSQQAPQAQIHQKDMIDKTTEFLGAKRPTSFGEWVGLVADITNRVYSMIDIFTGRQSARQFVNQTQASAVRFNYAAVSNNQPSASVQAGNANQANPGYRFPQIEYNSRGQAEYVLAQLKALIASEYRNATVADWYDFSELTSPNGYTDNRYGWYNLDNAVVKEMGWNSGKYYIDFPPVCEVTSNRK